jgi:hypothetical protein
VKRGWVVAGKDLRRAAAGFYHFFAATAAASRVTEKGL